MNKPQNTPEEIYSEATEGSDLASGDLRLLTSGLTALRKAHEKPLNAVELQAISGMIAYVAYSQEVDEMTVCEILAAHYGLTEVKALPSRLYQSAIEYLVDLHVNSVVN
jgi:hypothetical protein